MNAYELSRLYRQGWNAAKTLLADGHFDDADDGAAALNPYRTAEERARWSDGFTQALSSGVKPFNAPGGSGWNRGRARRDAS